MNIADADDSRKVCFLRCDVIRETDKAFLIDVAGKQGWIPKSQVRLDDKNGGCRLPVWLAKKHRWGTT